MVDAASAYENGSANTDMTSTAPPLFLHIGRGKSGSSTIQSLAADHAPFMKSHGVICPLTVHGIANHARLASALRDRGSDPKTLKKFRKDVRKYQKAKVFISGEALFSLSRTSLEHLKRLVGDRETRILCYVREYPGWLQSVYAQRTKRAVNKLDFDEYYRATRETTTVLPRIERWAEAFGWDNMHIRPLDSGSLAGGDLITDVLKALDVKASPGDVEPLNITPHWITLELQRALVRTAEAEGATIDARAVRVTRALFERCAANVKPSKVQYFTKQQWRDLADLYTADMSALGKRTGTSFKINLKEPQEREFLPGFGSVPASVVASVRDNLELPEYSSRLHPEITSLLRKLVGA